MIEILPHQSSESDVIKETQDDLSRLREQINDYDFLTNERLKQALENYDGSWTLNLSHMDITDDDLFYASSKIASLQGVVIIDLSYNRLEIFWSANDPILTGCSKLHQLDLSHNAIIEFNSNFIDKKTAASLQILNLDNNGDQENGDFLDSIRNLHVFKNLKRLSAQNNNLNANSFFQRYDNKYRLTSLESLYLKGNHIVNMDRLRMFPGLQILDVRENDFFKLSLLWLGSWELSKSVLTPPWAAFTGISKIHLKKLYLDELILNDLEFLMSIIDGGQEVLEMRDKKGMQLQAN